VQAVVFGGDTLPTVVRVIEHVDLAMLAMHNMSPGTLPPGQPGLWYPAVIPKRVDSPLIDDANGSE
jgi:hypothetical protein